MHLGTHLNQTSLVRRIQVISAIWITEIVFAS